MVCWWYYAQILWYTVTDGHQRVNTLRPRQNGRHLPDDILICIFFNENVWILIKISLNFVCKCPINNIPSLAWRRPGDKPLSEPMMVDLLTDICVTQPQWVNEYQGHSSNCIQRHKCDVPSVIISQAAAYLTDCSQSEPRYQQTAHNNK